MCKRNTPDPLVRMFLDVYGLNLLAVPREGSAVGDLYIRDKNGVSAPGRVKELLEGPLKLPPVHKGETMADITGVLSQGVSTKVGLDFLGRFIAAFGGAAALIDKLGATYKASKAASLKFCFNDATRDSMDPIAFGARLTECKPLDDHPMIAEGNQYFVVTAVARTPSISVVAERSNDVAASVDIDVKGLATASPSVEVKRSNSGEITFKGGKALAFGVQLQELIFDRDHKRIRMQTTGAVAVRATGARRPIATHAFLMGPNEEVFVSVEEDAATV